MKRILVLYLGLAAAVVMMVTRLFLLQIVLGEKNRAIAEGNRIRRVTLYAPRGAIFDRAGRELTRNVPVYRHCKLPGKRLINEPEKSANCRLIEREEALRLEAEGLPADEEIRLQVGREYLYGSALAPVTGYLNWDLAGTTGIEGEYEGVLKGKDGGELFEVDTGGVKIRQIERVEPAAGVDVHLSVDAELSKVAFEAFEGKPGALVATEAKTGRVIALVSSPAFEPELFARVRPGGEESGEERNRELAGIFEDPLKPLFNRAIGGLYPPGSTFKIVTAAAGLEEGKIDRAALIEDTGYIQVGEYRYRNWYFIRTGKAEGPINVVRALQRSTDTFFYKVGEMVGAENLAEWAGAFGLGKTAGIDIEGEAAGLVPTPDWKEEVIGERWYLGNTYHLSIGQGDLQLTPLQVNLMTGVIANGGRWCKPQLIQKSIRQLADKDQNDSLKWQNESEWRNSNTSDGDRLSSRSHGSSEVGGECRDLKLRAETISLIKEGLVAACSPGGTSGIFLDLRREGPTSLKLRGVNRNTGEQEGGESLDPGQGELIQVACKTGTAEFGPVKENGFRETHAWFTAFAPAEDPEIVVSVVVEGGGEGGEVAAPIVKKVLEAWFNRE